MAPYKKKPGVAARVLSSLTKPASCFSPFADAHGHRVERLQFNGVGTVTTVCPSLLPLRFLLKDGDWDCTFGCNVEISFTLISVVSSRKSGGLSAAGSYSFWTAGTCIVLRFVDSSGAFRKPLISSGCRLTLRRSVPWSTSGQTLSMQSWRTLFPGISLIFTSEPVVRSMRRSRLLTFFLPALTLPGSNSKRFN